MNKAIKKILNIAIDVIIILILIISVLVVVLALTSKSSGIANLFGIAPLTVSSQSMKDTLNENDLIFAKLTNDPSYRYEKGDIVTFYIDDVTGDGAKDLNTHRIVEVVEEDGKVYYKTQGDNKIICPEPDRILQSSETILAKFDEGGFKIPGLGGFLSFIRTQLGFFLVILLPMILFFVYQAIRVIMNIIAYNKEKAAEEAAAAVANSDLTEEQKQRAIEEYLAKQKAQESETAVQTPADGGSSDAES